MDGSDQNNLNQPNDTNSPTYSTATDGNNQQVLLPTDTSLNKKPNHKRKYIVFLLIILLLIAGSIGAVLAFHHKPAVKTLSASTNNKSSSQTSSTQASNTNTWKGTVDPTALPLGDGHVSTTPQVGYVDSCTTNFNGGGAQHAGSWINTSNSTWNSETKIAVQGSNSWPNASYSAAESGNSRVITTNDLPEGETTGNFPIALTDPAHQYDGNPNHIAAQTINWSLPLNPTAATSPSCTGLGPIGVLSDGVLLFNALDAGGRDAVAHEVQDSCDGHPDGSDEYHYHGISSCLLKKATASSTLVGYAADGYGIYVERDSKGNLPTDADLDVCHGRTSEVMWNGKLTNIYHYDATLEYPYTIGCFHGSPINTHGA